MLITAANKAVFLPQTPCPRPFLTQECRSCRCTAPICIVEMPFWQQDKAHTPRAPRSEPGADNPRGFARQRRQVSADPARGFGSRGAGARVHQGSTCPAIKRRATTVTKHQTGPVSGRRRAGPWQTRAQVPLGFQPQRQEQKCFRDA